MSIQKLGLKNFRVFKEQTDFDLAPITVFTGPNNSGKSTAIKAMILISESALKTELNFLLQSGTNTSFSNPKLLKNESTDESKLGIDVTVNLANSSIIYSGDNDIGETILLMEVFMKEKGKSPKFEFFNKNINIKLEYDFLESNQYQLTALNLCMENSLLFNYTNNNGVSKIKLDNEWYFDIFFSHSIVDTIHSKATKQWINEFEHNLSSDGIKIDLKQSILKIWFELEESLKVFFESYTFETKHNARALSKTIESINWNSENVFKIISGEISSSKSKNKEIDFSTKIFNFLKSINCEQDQTLFIKIWNCLEEGVNQLTQQYVLTASYLIKILSLKISEQINYLPTFRHEPLRNYTRNDKSILSKMLFDIYDNNKYINDTNKIPNQYETVGKGEIKFSSEAIDKIFKIGKSIRLVENIEEGSLELKIITKQKPEGINITDMGFGTFQILTLLLSIEMAIIDGGYFEDSVYIPETGQAEKYEMPSKSTLLIEEPEISLHPNFQSKLADVLTLANKKYGVNFVLETHSEYLIRKLQYLTLKKELTPDNTKIYYLNSLNDITKKDIQVKEISIKENGLLTSSFGKGFLDETTTIMTALLTGENLN